MIYHVQAYAKDKLYGKALNDHIGLLPSGCWVVVRDMDTLPLTPNWVDHLYTAIQDHPDTILFTCATNRVWGKPIDPESDMRKHLKIAHLRQREKDYKLISGTIPAFFWMFPKSIWEQCPFDEHPILYPPNRPSTFDKRWCDSLPHLPKRCINHLYMWHTYRLNKFHRDYHHLL